MTYVGGLRDRLIHDSIFHAVNDGLHVLGWFPGGAQAPTDFPLHVVAEQMDWSVEIPFNTVSVASYSTSDIEAELGSDLRANRWVFYVDVFGANEAIGLQLSGDVRDILRGKNSALAHFVTPSTLHVLDYSLATPVELFTCDLDRVNRDRAVQTTHRWMNYMFSISATLTDWYNNDEDDTYHGETP